MNNQETHKSPLDNLYDDFDDFDLGQTVERLKKETKMLKECIKEQNKDITKLADTIVELKTCNQKLSNNISSLYTTAKSEIDRKNKLIAELRREKDNITFRRQDRYRNNNMPSIPPQNTGYNMEVNKNNHSELQNNVAKVKEEVVDNSTDNYNRNEHVDNLYQQRFKQERNTCNNKYNMELPIPQFVDETGDRLANQSDQFKDRSRSREHQERSRSREHQDNKHFENQNFHRNDRGYWDDRSRNRSTDWRKEKSTNIRCEKNNERRRGRSTDRNSDKSIDRRRNKSMDVRRDRSNDRRRDKSNFRYKKEYGRYEDSDKTNYANDKFSKRRYDSREDNLYGAYERSKSRNPRSPERKTEHNLWDSKPHKSSKGKKMLKVVDKMEKEVTNLTKMETSHFEQLLKLPTKQKKDENEDNDEVEGKARKKKKKNNKDKQEAVENKPASTDNKRAINNYFGTRVNNILDDVMDNIKSKNLISTTPNKIYSSSSKTISEDELSLMETRFEILNSIGQENPTHANGKAPEENMIETNEEKLENKLNTSESIEMKNENVDDIFSTDTDLNQTESIHRELLTFIETTKTKKEGKLKVEDIFGVDSSDTVKGNKSSEDVGSQDNKHSYKTHEEETFSKSSKIEQQTELDADKISHTDLNDNMNSNNNEELAKAEKQKNKEKLIMKNIFGEESSDLFDEDNHLKEFKQSVQNATDKSSKPRNSSRNKSLPPKKLLTKIKGTYYCHMKHNITKEKKEIKKKIEKLKSSLLSSKTEVTVNKKGETTDASSNLILIEKPKETISESNVDNSTKITKQLENFSDDKNISETNLTEKLQTNHEIKDSKLKTEHKPSLIQDNDEKTKEYSNKSIKTELNSTISTSGELVKDNPKPPGKKIIIVSDVVIVPSPTDEQNSYINHTNQAHLIDMPNIQEGKQTNSPKPNNVNKKSISKKVRLLEKFASEETSNKCDDDLKQTEKSMHHDKQSNSNKNLKRKHTEDVNPPKKRKIYLDALEDGSKEETKLSNNPVSKKSTASSKDKTTHRPIRRSERINSKEKMKASTSTEEIESCKENTNNKKQLLNTIEMKENEIVEVPEAQIKLDSENLVQQLVNEKLEYLNNGKTERHSINILNDSNEISASTMLHTHTSDRLSPAPEKTFSLDKSIEKVQNTQLNQTPSPLSKAADNIDGEVAKTPRRIKPTPVKDVPVCSFKDILAKNNNTMKLFSKTVAIETNLTEESDIPILHLEEINLSHIEDMTQKTFDNNIKKLLDYMNSPDLDCDASKLNLQKFENNVQATNATNEPITPPMLPCLATSTPKVSTETTRIRTDVEDNIVANNVQNNQTTVINNKIDSDQKCEGADNNQINKPQSVNTPARFRRRCRIVAVVKND